ncbi:MAG: hypothetical protein GY749_05010 [Desulfobacteraceae bacterium]|nr:hypothetical protein [Desulfobacteraceae bacterium]
MLKRIIVFFFILLAVGCSSKKQSEPVNLAELGLVKTGHSNVSAPRSGYYAQRESCPASFSGNIIEINGSVSYRIKENLLTLYADSIVSNRNNSSGNLFLKLWATDTLYTGGKITGYVLGTAEIGRLRGGDSFQNIETAVPYSEPPLGQYFLTITLTEQNEQGETIMDYMAFPNAGSLGQ